MNNNDHTEEHSVPLNSNFTHVYTDIWYFYSTYSLLSALDLKLLVTPWLHGVHMHGHMKKMCWISVQNSIQLNSIQFYLYSAITIQLSLGALQSPEPETPLVQAQWQHGQEKTPC